VSLGVILKEILLLQPNLIWSGRIWLGFVQWFSTDCIHGNGDVCTVGSFRSRYVYG